ncbi:MAG: hypothetical protein ACREPT_05655 [Rudaea sp.]
MKRSIESGKALADELTAVACTETGQSREVVALIVKPIARYLDREYGGQKLYKKSSTREALLADVKRDMDMKIPKRVICRIHNISTSKLYRLLHGDPEPQANGAAKA